MKRFSHPNSPLNLFERFEDGLAKQPDVEADERHDNVGAQKGHVLRVVPLAREIRGSGGQTKRVAASTNPSPFPLPLSPPRTTPAYQVRGQQIGDAMVVQAHVERGAGLHGQVLRQLDEIAEKGCLQQGDVRGQGRLPCQQATPLPLLLQTHAVLGGVGVSVGLAQRTEQIAHERPVVFELLDNLDVEEEDV